MSVLDFPMYVVSPFVKTMAGESPEARNAILSVPDVPSRL